MEEHRNRVESAAVTLGHSVLRAEKLGAASTTPQRACLDLVRSSDVVILILGRRYGDVQPSGLSATHEEFREARERARLLCFIESGVDRDPEQKAFVREVQNWATGYFTSDFVSTDDLSRRVTKALHDLEVSLVAAPDDVDEIVARARALVEIRDRHSQARICLGLALGPRQTVVAPSVLVGKELRQLLKREALTGDFAVLSTESGTRELESGGQIILEQDKSVVALDELGSIFVSVPISSRNRTGLASLMAVIEEDLIDQLDTTLGFCDRVLDYVDQPHRLSHFVAAAALSGASYLGWQTRQQHSASPRSVSVGLGGERPSAVLSPPQRPRTALGIQRRQLAEDLVALIKRGRSS